MVVEGGSAVLAALRRYVEKIEMKDEIVCDVWWLSSSQRMHHR